MPWYGWIALAGIGYLCIIDVAKLVATKKLNDRLTKIENQLAESQDPRPLS